MAKLDHMPSLATIVAQRGRVDYYFWKGIPVARMWPRKSSQPRTAGEIKSSQMFSVAAKLTGALPPQLVRVYRREMANGVGVTWVDWVRNMARTGSWFVER